MTSHTIGEVLNRLKDEFDDITISKIRYLEAEGLITPDRTESGYRKFTVADIDRLRYVLRAQRDRYLPLKVIKDELARLDAGQPLTADAPGQPHGGDTEVATLGSVQSATGPVPVHEVSAAGASNGTAASAPTHPRSQLDDDSAATVELSRSELTDATGLTDTDIKSLTDHDLVGPGPRYNGDDLAIARLAAQLLAAGLEARHLRMYRQFANREFALLEQLVTPLLRQRNPDSRAAAREQAQQLTDVGGDLHQLLLARELRTLLRS